MADKKVNVDLSIDAAGVAKGAKKATKEITAVGKGLDDLKKIEAFQQSEKNLESLQGELKKAKKDFADLSAEAEKSGKEMAASHAKAESSVKELSAALKLATKEANAANKANKSAADSAAKQYDSAKVSLAELRQELVQARAKSKELAAEAKKGGDTHKKAYQDSKKEIADLAVQLSKAQAETKELGRSSRDAGQKFRAEKKKSAASVKTLSTSLKVAEKNLKSISAEAVKSGRQQAAAMGKAEAAVDRLTAGIKSENVALKQNAAALKGTEVNLNKIGEEQRLAIARYKALSNAAKRSSVVQAKAQDKALKGAKRLNRELDKSAKKAHSVGDAMAGAAAATGAVYGAGRGIKFFADYDDTMRRVGAVTQATAEEMQGLTELTKELGATTRFTATQSAEGMVELAQAGLSVKDIYKVLPDVMDVTAASGLEFKEVASLLTDTLKQFGFGMEESGRASDILVKGAVSASHNVELLGEALSYVGPIAKGAGYSMEQTVSVLNALADAGFKGERGGTAFRAGLIRLTKVVPKTQKILDKYNLSILDSEGRMKDFADVMEEVGQAGLTQSELFQVFGTTAGPGMQSLLTLGSDSIRDYQTALEDAGGTANRIGTEMEAGIGGSLRKLLSALQAIVVSLADSVAPAISTMADGLAVVGKLISKAPKPIQATAVAIGAAVTATVAWNLGLKYLGRALLVSVAPVKAVIVKTWAYVAATNAATVAANGLKIAAGGVFAVSAVAVVGAVKGYNSMRDAQKEAAGAADRLSESQERLAGKFKKISQDTGVSIKNFDDFKEALRTGAIEATGQAGEYVKGSGKIKKASQDNVDAQQKVSDAAKKTADDVKLSVEEIEKAEKKALKERETAWQQYAEKIASIQDQIAGKEISLAEKLRSMERGGMSDIDAWRDRKKQAEEYAVAAEKAAAASDYEKAVDLAEKAESAYEDLNKEVKEGDKVLISGADALKTSMAGVESAGKLAIDILKQQEEAAKLAADALNETGGFGEMYTEAGQKAKELNDIQEEYNAKITAAGDNWAEVWRLTEEQGVAAAKVTGDAWDEATKDRYITTYVKEVVQRAAGGFANPAAVPRHKGLISGPGGIDNVFGMLTAKEYVIKQDAVMTNDLDGVNLAHAFNRQDWGGMYQILGKKFVPQGATRKKATDTINVNFQNQATGEAGQVQVAGNKPDLEAWNRALTHQHLVRSRKT